ncbi:TCR/Tet family MFS transporter [Pseudogemmobacter sonorensis]|uniref:TCR/Tet family MFS transporter n=1 Tax=Pseudogemmobacter sonorensis TaxID=2989681 RepID=UPI0036926258
MSRVSDAGPDFPAEPGAAASAAAGSRGPSDPQGGATTKASRHGVVFVLVTVFLDMVGYGLIIPVLPALIREVGGLDIGRAAAMAGWMFAAFSVAHFLCAPLAGNLSDRFGRRPLLLLAIFGLGVDFLISAWAPTLFWLFVGRILTGVCGASWVIANAYIADVTAPEERARAFGLMGAAFGLGFVIGPGIGGLLGEFGPRVPFLAAAAISLLNFGYGWFVLRESLAPEKRRPFEWRRANPFGAFRVFRSYPGVLPMCLVLGLFFFSSSVYQAVWTFWGIAKFGWSEGMVGLTLTVFGLVMAGFQGGLTGLFTRRLGEHRTILVGLVCAIVAAFGYGFAGGVVMVFALMVVHGPEGFVHPLLSAAMTRRVPEDAQGELQGGISAIMSVAMLAGTLAFSQTFDFFWNTARGQPSPDVAYWLAGACLSATLLLYLRLARRDGGSGK